MSKWKYHNWNRSSLLNTRKQKKTNWQLEIRARKRQFSSKSLIRSKVDVFFDLFIFSSFIFFLIFICFCCCFFSFLFLVFCLLKTSIIFMIRVTTVNLKRLEIMGNKLYRNKNKYYWYWPNYFKYSPLLFRVMYKIVWAILCVFGVCILYQISSTLKSISLKIFQLSSIDFCFRIILFQDSIVSFINFKHLLNSIGYRSYSFCRFEFS